MKELVEKLRDEGPALSQRVLEEMYADPFWMERFGSKGRRHADEDSDFHLRYLSRALVAGDPGVLVRYARWLREVLATRGMCSRHLDDNFRRLARRLSEQGWQGTDLAIAFLQAARESLRWEAGPAGELQREAAQLADELDAGPLVEAARDLLSYLLDAVALRRPDLFAAHVHWMEGHLERRGVGASGWRALLRRLEGALARDETHLEALDCVRAAAH